MLRRFLPRAFTFLIVAYVHASCTYFDQLGIGSVKEFPFEVRVAVELVKVTFFHDTGFVWSVDIRLGLSLASARAILCASSVT